MILLGEYENKPRKMTGMLVCKEVVGLWQSWKMERNASSMCSTGHCYVIKQVCKHLPVGFAINTASTVNDILYVVLREYSRSSLVCRI